MKSGRTFTLEGFKSRWMMPCSCAASSASAICFANTSASSGEWVRADPVRERFAFHEFKDKGGHASTVFDAMDRRDVWMVQGGEDFGFALATAPADQDWP